MKPYWKFRIEWEKKMYYKQEASWWFCIYSIDGEHFVNIPMDSPECDLPIQLVIGRFFKDVAKEWLR